MEAVDTTISPLPVKRQGEVALYDTALFKKINILFEWIFWILKKWIFFLMNILDFKKNIFLNEYSRLF